MHEAIRKGADMRWGGRQEGKRRRTVEGDWRVEGRKQGEGRCGEENEQKSRKGENKMEEKRS
jgi:hypothetical protein